MIFPGEPHHVTQRGHNRERCFHVRGDHVLYLGLLREHAAETGCAVHAYVLMPNHVHLLVTPPERDSISELLSRVNQRYVQSLNRHHGRCGTAWQGRFHASVVDSRSYFMTCQRYIELNPVRAGLARRAEEYPWSSFHTYALGRPSPVPLAEHAAYLALGPDEACRRTQYAALFEAELPQHMIDRIRIAAMGGRPLGDDAFIETMRAKYGPVVARQKRGPKARREAAPASQSLL